MDRPLPRHSDGRAVRPCYLKLNPKGVVPTLVDDGDVIRESTLICEYLDEKFPDTPLKPDSPAGKVHMRTWTKFIDEYVHPMCAVLTFSASHRHTINRLGRGVISWASAVEVDETYVGGPQTGVVGRQTKTKSIGFDGSEVVKAVKTFDTMLRDMDAVLADNEWLAGATVSLADGCDPLRQWRLELFTMLSPWPPERPRVMGWFER